MPFAAKIYICVILALGTASASAALLVLQSSGLLVFATFFLLCNVTSLLRVTLPLVEGSLSLNYVFLIWGVARLGLGETILMGTVSAVVQSYWRCRKQPQPIQVGFNLALISVSISASYLFFRSAALQAVIPSEVIRLLLASVVYYLVNTVGVTVVIALTDNRPVWDVWSGSYLWTFPHYVLAPAIVVAGEALKRVIGTEFLLLGVPAVYLVFHTFQMHISGLKQALERMELETKHAMETTNLHLRTIRALALAIEAKDRTTGEHLHRVQTYALGLATEFGLDQQETEALRAAAILHDIGKIAVPEHIISKPGKLTPDEFQKMKIHATVGAEIIESVRFPFAVAPLVRAHHEKWDGTGYPNGLRGEEIPLGARILAAVDVLDALASDRQYRKAMPLDDAMGIVQRESGKSFDPKVIEALGRKYRELEQLAKATLEADTLELSVEADVSRGTAPDAGFASGWEESGPNLSRDKAADEAHAIATINLEISRNTSLENTVTAIAGPLASLIPYDCLAVYTKDNGVLRCVLTRGESGMYLSHLTIPLGIGVSGWVASTGRPLLNGNPLTEFGLNAAVPSAFSLQSGLSVALESEFGTSGVLTLYRNNRDAFTPGHLRILLAIAPWFAYCTRRPEPLTSFPFPGKPQADEGQYGGDRSVLPFATQVTIQ